ncbi:MAG: DNA polymerase I [Parcubacteria group bacterium Gr01-1014_3]|nr:MAG: DNA polymerase I [Parcubacteria group bacterium Gr01-1014_3]
MTDLKKIEIAKWLLDAENQQNLPDDLESLEKKITEEGLDKVYREIELPLVPILDSMHELGIKVDAKILEKVAKELNKEIATLEEQIHKAAGLPFNLNSPKQLSEVLFEKLKIDTKGVPKRKTGAFSTDAETLDKIKDRNPVVASILKYRELYKMKSTYAEPLLELAKADKESRIHTTFLQTITSTGRLSSKDPNLQNIPVLSDWGKRVREAFVAEKGHSLLSLDYSQIELRVLASVANDEKMIEAFRQGEDIHRLTASQVFNIPLKEVTKEQRQMAKTLNFGVIYGMGADGLARASGMSREESAKFIAEYFADFADIKRWQEKTINKARQTGYVETLNGRKRWLPNIMAGNRRFAAESERMATNMPIQGLAADIIKLAMIRVAEMLKKKKLEDKVKMLLTIHDELIFEVTDDLAKEAEELIRPEMEKAYELIVPLKVDSAIGKNWSEI